MIMVQAVLAPDNQERGAQNNLPSFALANGMCKLVVPVIEQQ